MIIDSSGNLLIADGLNHRVRRVDAATGFITTVAGTGVAGFAGDGGLPTAASLNLPRSLALDASGNLFIADFGNHRVRRVDGQTGIITTVAGTGVAGSLGDGGQAMAAQLDGPRELLIDVVGNIYIADITAHRVRRILAGSGVIATVAGNGVAASAGDGGPAIQASLNSPRGLILDEAGSLFVAEARGCRVRRIDAATATISTVVGAGILGFNGDGRLPEQTWLSPAGLVFNAARELLIADAGNVRIRLVTAHPPSPGAVPDGSDPSRPGLNVTPEPGGDVRLTWSASCMDSGYDFEIYEGSLESPGSHAARVCSTAKARSIVVTPGLGNRYFLVVPRNLLREGSYGAASDGVPRPAGTASCLPQETATGCP